MKERAPPKAKENTISETEVRIYGEMTASLSGLAQNDTVVDIWSPDSGDESEALEMISILQANHVAMNVVRIRSLYQPELHVGFDEYVGVSGVRRFLKERHNRHSTSAR